MKEKMTNEQLIREELREQAQQVRVNLEVAYNIFDNTVDSASDMKLISKGVVDPVTSAISRLNYCEKEFRNFYSRTKEKLSLKAKSHN